MPVSSPRVRRHEAIKPLRNSLTRVKTHFGSVHRLRRFGRLNDAKQHIADRLTMV
jgi:hypothetical protein